jgi:hypothetical protein
LSEQAVGLAARFYIPQLCRCHRDHWRRGRFRLVKTLSH